MTYTPEQVRAMSDAELCEALDKQRGVDFTMNLELPTNYWFAPENWTKVLDEFPEWVTIENTGRGWHIYNQIGGLNFPNGVRSDRLSRAVLEAALLCGQEA